MQHQWVDITKSAHSYPKREKSERNTWAEKPRGTGLTGPADWSDRSIPTASKFKPIGLTGLHDRSDRSDSDRETASFWERGIYTPHPHPFVGADTITFQSHFWALKSTWEVLPNLSLWDLSESRLDPWVGLSETFAKREIWAVRA